MQMGFTCCCILKFQGIFIRKFVLGTIHMSQWARNGICTAVTGYPSSPTLGTGTTHLWGPIPFLVTKSSLVWIVQELVSQLLFREKALRNFGYNISFIGQSSLSSNHQLSGQS